MNKTVNPFVYQRIMENDIPNSTIPAWLKETYAQAYEDIIIESLLRAHIRKINRNLNITYIEIGANHPVCTSSTYLWQRKYGMTGILVEANPKLIPTLQKFRPKDKIIHAAVTDENVPMIDFYLGQENEISSLNSEFVASWKNLGIQEKISVPTIKINSLLEMVSNVEFVILIIDVEGMDLKLLKDIDFDKHRPFIIETEPSDAFAPGTSIAMIDYLKSHDYSLVSESDHNLIFQDNKKSR